MKALFIMNWDWLRREGNVKRMSEGCKKHISNFCEMVKFLWNMFYYNDINSGMYLQT